MSVNCFTITEVTLRVCVRGHRLSSFSAVKRSRTDRCTPLRRHVAHHPLLLEVRVASVGVRTGRWSGPFCLALNGADLHRGRESVIGERKVTVCVLTEFHGDGDEGEAVRGKEVYKGPSQGLTVGERLRDLPVEHSASFLGSPFVLGSEDTCQAPGTWS